MEKVELPIVEMLERYAGLESVRLHMPGHKGNCIGFLQAVSKYDITELDFSDNLLDPVGVIKRSEELFARQMGVEKAHYSVNGATTALFAIVNNCSTLLIERCAHYSVFNAVRTLKKNAYVISNNIIDGVPQPVSAEQIKQAVKYRKIDAVLINGASYYGLRADVESIYKLMRANNIKLYVDAAHGAHYGLSEYLPNSFANTCDAYVISTHKTLSSLTQTAALCVNNADIDKPLKDSLVLFTTSSPSYILLASMDYLRVDLAFAREAYGRLYAAYKEFCANAESDGIEILKNDDFTRLVVSCGASGKEIYERLSEQGVYCEFFDQKRVCMFITYKDDTQVYDTVRKAFLSSFPKRCAAVHSGSVCIYGCSRLKLNLGECVSVPLLSAIGRVSGEDVIEYPPGIPVILRGERINAEHARRLVEMNKGGRNIAVEKENEGILNI